MRNIVDCMNSEDYGVGRNVLQLTVHQFAESLGNAIDAKDHCTSSHSEEVAVITKALGIKLKLDKSHCNLLHIAGHLHDIGKIGIPDRVLKKKGRLTSAEYKLIKTHPVMGAKIVEPVTLFDGDHGITEMILHHHERFDGKGYPNGLKGEEIPYGARIIAVADTISAMASNRPYRDALPFRSIVYEIGACSGSQFDPTVVNAFLDIADKIEDYMLEVGHASEVVLFEQLEK